MFSLVLVVICVFGLLLFLLYFILFDGLIAVWSFFKVCLKAQDLWGVSSGLMYALELSQTLSRANIFGSYTMD